MPPAASHDYDAIIIGAGINGAGIARDATLRGLRVLLLDKGDLGGGTSGWATRLIHGGLRYLEYGEVGLVRESLREREILLRIAPHLVKPLPLLVPLYAEPQRRPKWMIRAGMWAYDALSYDKSLPRHHFRAAAETLRQAPGLRADKLRGAAVYYDAQVEFPERLVVENALAARAQGAEVRTYARVERLIVEGGAVRGVEFTDRDGDHTARAPVVLNVAGPWVDAVLRGLPQPPARLIGGTKGSHLVVRPFAGQPPEAVYVEARTDRRPFFIIPWNDLCLIGTTDLPFTGDLDCVSATEDEIAYLLDETNWLFPDAQLNRDAVLYTYSGVRPLPYVAAGRPAGITRRHFIHDHAPEVCGLLSVIGGKLTTYRSLAQEATDAIFHQLRRPAPPCTTDTTPLPGAVDWSKSSPANHLQRVYGAVARKVVSLAQEDAALAQVFDELTGATAAAIVYALRYEAAHNLADILLRRTMVGLNARAGLGADEKAAAIARQHLGWTPERARQEVAQYRAYVARFHPHPGVI